MSDRLSKRSTSVTEFGSARAAETAATRAPKRHIDAMDYNSDYVNFQRDALWKNLEGSELLRAVSESLAHILHERPEFPVAELAASLKRAAEKKRRATTMPQPTLSSPVVTAISVTLSGTSSLPLNTTIETAPSPTKLMLPLNKGKPQEYKATFTAVVTPTMRVSLSLTPRQSDLSSGDAAKIPHPQSSPVTRSVAASPVPSPAPISDMVACGLLPLYGLVDPFESTISRLFEQLRGDGYSHVRVLTLRGDLDIVYIDGVPHTTTLGQSISSVTGANPSSESVAGWTIEALLQRNPLSSCHTVLEVVETCALKHRLKVLHNSDCDVFLKERCFIKPSMMQQLCEVLHSETPPGIDLTRIAVVVVSHAESQALSEVLATLYCVLSSQKKMAQAARLRRANADVRLVSCDMKAEHADTASRRAHLEDTHNALLKRRAERDERRRLLTLQVKKNVDRVVPNAPTGPKAPPSEVQLALDSLRRAADARERRRRRNDSIFRRMLNAEQSRATTVVNRTMKKYVEHHRRRSKRPTDDKIAELESLRQAGNPPLLSQMGGTDEQDERRPKPGDVDYYDVLKLVSSTCTAQYAEVLTETTSLPPPMPRRFAVWNYSLFPIPPVDEFDVESEDESWTADFSQRAYIQPVTAQHTNINVRMAVTDAMVDCHCDWRNFLRGANLIYSGVAAIQERTRRILSVIAHWMMLVAYSALRAVRHPSTQRDGDCVLFEPWIEKNHPALSIVIRHIGLAIPCLLTPTPALLASANALPLRKDGPADLLHFTMIKLRNPLTNNATGCRSDSDGPADAFWWAETDSPTRQVSVGQWRASASELAIQYHIPRPARWGNYAPASLQNLQQRNDGAPMILARLLHPRAPIVLVPAGAQTSTLHMLAVTLGTGAEVLPKAAGPPSGPSPNASAKASPSGPSPNASPNLDAASSVPHRRVDWFLPLPHPILYMAGNPFLFALRAPVKRTFRTAEIQRAQPSEVKEGDAVLVPRPPRQGIVVAPRLSMNADKFASPPDVPNSKLSAAVPVQGAINKSSDAPEQSIEVDYPGWPDPSAVPLASAPEIAVRTSEASWLGLHISAVEERLLSRVESNLAQCDGVIGWYTEKVCDNDAEASHAVQVSRVLRSSGQPKAEEARQYDSVASDRRKTRQSTVPRVSNPDASSPNGISATNSSHHNASMAVRSSRKDSSGSSALAEALMHKVARPVSSLNVVAPAADTPAAELPASVGQKGVLQTPFKMAEEVLSIPPLEASHAVDVHGLLPVTHSFHRSCQPCGMYETVTAVSVQAHRMPQTFDEAEGYRAVFMIGHGQLPELQGSVLAVAATLFWFARCASSDGQPVRPQVDELMELTSMPLDALAHEERPSVLSAGKIANISSEPSEDESEDGGGKSSSRSDAEGDSVKPLFASVTLTSVRRDSTRLLLQRSAGASRSDPALLASQGRDVKPSVLTVEENGALPRTLKPLECIRQLQNNSEVQASVLDLDDAQLVVTALLIRSGLHQTIRGPIEALLDTAQGTSAPPSTLQAQHKLVQRASRALEAYSILVFFQSYLVCAAWKTTSRSFELFMDHHGSLKEFLKHPKVLNGEFPVPIFGSGLMREQHSTAVINHHPMKAAPNTARRPTSPPAPPQRPLNPGSVSARRASEAADPHATKPPPLPWPLTYPCFLPGDLDRLMSWERRWDDTVHMINVT